MSDQTKEIKNDKTPQSAEKVSVGLKNWIPVIFIISAAVILAFICFCLRPASTSGVKHITVQVEHLDGRKNTFEYETEQEYLREVLCEENGLIDGSEEAYGLWVKTVDGETANEANQEWWSYSINGTDAMYGVEQQAVTDGDWIVFTLRIGY